MQIGILTMHRVKNYGSFLQAYALKSVVESLGHSVTFRDFHHGSPRHLGQKVVAPSLVKKVAKIPQLVANLHTTISKHQFRHRFNTRFEHDFMPMLGVGISKNYNLQADAMVIGSDEVFNYCQNQVFGYVPCLFGHDITAKKIMSYAASAGYANWNDVIADNMVDELGSGFKKMSDISVRDENTRLLVEVCTGQSPTMVVDPTLIYDFDAHLPKQRIVDGNYLLVYAYEGRMDSAREINAVKAFALQHQLKVISVGAYHAWCDDNIVVSPFEVLSLFKEAAYIVTETFHGSIFAMKYGKQFAAFVRSDNPLGSNANKLTYLLHQFGMESRIVSTPEALEQVLLAKAPVEVFNERLAKLSAQSLQFLKQALQ
jgi:hypothetical protein